ncbi:MAG: leucine--tRNA ligase [Candidatus Pacebacteria bacterium]|nr:leucine--tRNA ligase [Candidatus Paceibacterota bacterium]
MKYNSKEIEQKWQKYWKDNGTNKTKESSQKQKYYVLDMFPYPSGVGLHVGHFKGYVATDIVARTKRMQGFEVLHPMGWDAFGLPAENFAIKTGIHPEITTEKNIANIKHQMQIVGLSYDWDREINTTDRDYYKWTQWIFLKLYEKGLAYKKLLPINWCPSCKTGLANEEVVDGKCERCGTETTKKDIEQWILRITAYADRLLEDLDSLDWPEKIKEMQKNWIGRSEGWEIDFEIEDTGKAVTVFTTRIDTLFGCTYVVLAPESEVLTELKNRINNWDEVFEYIEKSKNKSDLERVSEVKGKSGIELKGLKAINPINGKDVRVFVADYVLASYGTGAVMAVPAHDERDFEFAIKYNLPIIEVVRPKDGDSNISESAFVQDGYLINSDSFTDMDSESARKAIGESLREEGFAREKVNYKLHDWPFSRQRYWGEPIPIIHCNNCGIVPLEEKNLPLTLPHIDKYEPTGTGESPLAAIESWVNIKCPKCGGLAKRETNTMPQWAGSCWYYLRYLDNNNDKVFVDSEVEKKWMPVDLYVGGAEHAVLHLLYSRFWHKFLFDIGAVSTKEPFQKLRNIGLVLAYDGQKMSKSKGNVISPDSVVEEYGADTLRVYEMFMGPFDQAIGWNEQGVKGVNRFLARVWDIVTKNKDILNSSNEVMSETQKLIKKVNDDLEKMKFNTPVAFFMEYVNFIYDNKDGFGKDSARIFIKLLFPFAPHICEEMWQLLGEQGLVSEQSWPVVDESLMKADKVVLIVQVNGKVRDRMEFDSDIDQEKAEEAVRNNDVIAKWIEGKKIKKVVFAKGKLINIVV